DCDQARLWVADGDYSGRPALDEALERRLLLAALDPIEYGTRLFEALFPGREKSLLAGYRTGLVIARREEKRLRFRLHIATSAPAKLHDLHWERLYDPEERIALACSRDVAFSRYLSVASGSEAAVAARPKLLVVICCPSDLAEYELPEISRERARHSILKALSPLGARVSWELLEGAVTVGSIRDRLVAGGFDALHLHAHGVLDPDRAAANLVLEDEDQRAAFVDEGLFSQLFEGERDLHLVTLIACHGGTQTGAEPFSGLAPALVRRGIPAVVAMRRAISVEGAARFSEHFYLNLARTGRVDTAANEARLQLYLAAPSGLEWSTPALSMRLAEGRLWQPAPASLDAEGTEGAGRRGFRRRWKGLVAAAIALVTAVPIAYFVHRCGEPTRVNAPGVVSVPADPEAARLYSEGLAKLLSFDAISARDLLEAAVEADPEHPLPRAALAAAWSELGYDGKAEQASKQARERSRSLPENEQLAIEARYYEITDEWDKAIEIYGSLFRSLPKDVHYGLRLAEAQIRGGRSRQALVTLEKLRRLPSPGSSDPRIDLAQALAHLRLGELRDSVTSAERAARKGNERGWDLLVARARLREAAALWEQGDYSRAIPALDDAEARFGAAGDRRGLAQTLEAKALAVQAQGDLDGSRNLLQRALTTYREIGDKRSEANVLVTLGNVF
ncbi:MAG: CHAT domain-containing protein, partial [bacterium]|nr:CHAT domain-containing protein [bacterium]